MFICSEKYGSYQGSRRRRSAKPVHIPADGRPTAPVCTYKALFDKAQAGPVRKIAEILNISKSPTEYRENAEERRKIAERLSQMFKRCNIA